MNETLRSALDLLLQQQSLDDVTAGKAIGAVMDGKCQDVEIAALLTALAVKGATESELAGAATAMRVRASHITSTREGLMDTCGTGGDQLHTFNISTATALVAAAAGIPIAKHGNRSVSSSSGSADVLEQLGVNIDLNAEDAGACLDQVGICFCYARSCHGAMKHVAPVRAQLGFRTIFNLLGPLTNPAGAKFQLLGAYSISAAERLAGATAKLGTARTMIVCGNGQLDEVALWGTTTCWIVEGSTIAQVAWKASDFGLPECKPSSLRVNSPQESAEVIQSVLQGKLGAPREMVLANVATALVCHGDVASLTEGVALAARTIDEGIATSKLQELVNWTQQRR